MANHYPELTRALESIGIPAVFPEPEVTRKAVAGAQRKALAKLIERHLNESEPLLSAACAPDGNVIVREKGGSGRFKITVESL